MLFQSTCQQEPALPVATNPIGDYGAMPTGSSEGITPALPLDTFLQDLLIQWFSPSR